MTTIQRARVSRQLLREFARVELEMEGTRTNRHTHTHARTLAEHVTQNIFFFYFPVVAAKFNTYDLYMNFNIDFLAFQHL